MSQDGPDPNPEGLEPQPSQDRPESPNKVRGSRLSSPASLQRAGVLLAVLLGIATASAAVY